MDIQIKPIISEKANACSDKLNCYTFAVSPDANRSKTSSKSSTMSASRE